MPYGLVIDAAGSYVVDGEAFGGTGGLIRVDPTTGAQTVLRRWQSRATKFSGAVLILLGIHDTLVYWFL